MSDIEGFKKALLKNKTMLMKRMIRVKKASKPERVEKK
jgi:hypothetical protein